MNPPLEEIWDPSPELLAAYFDGEFEGRVLFYGEVFKQRHVEVGTVRTDQGVPAQGSEG